MATRMQQRRGTAAQWTAANPVLAAGEIGFETDTNKFKMGNGTSTWSALQYFANAAELAAIVDGAPELLNTLNELAASLGDNPDFVGTVTAHTNDTTNVHGIADTSALVTQTDLTNAIAGAAVDQSSLAGTGIDWNSVAERFDIDETTIATVALLDERVLGGTSQLNAAVTSLTNLIDGHADSTFNIHGIADTSLLATQAYASGAVSDHNSDTTNVHGIVNTAELATKTYADQAVAGITKASVGLGNVDDTADAFKPVSAAQESAIGTAKTEAITAAGQAADTKISTHNSDTTNVHGIADTSALALTSDVNSALDLKQNKITGVSDTEIGYLDGVTSKIQDQLDGKSSSGHQHGITEIDGLFTSLQSKADVSGTTFTGDVTVETNLTVEGNLVVTGEVETISSTTVTIADPMIYLGEGNSGNSADLGFIANFNDGTYQHSGVVRDASAGKWKIFKGVTDEPTTTVNFSQGSLDDLAVNNIEVAGVVFSDGTQVKVGVPSITAFATAISSDATIASGEADKFVPLTGAVTITLPSSGYVKGQSIDFYQESGTGAQFASTNGVVGTPGLKFRTTNSVATAMKTDSGWLVFGDLSA